MSIAVHPSLGILNEEKPILRIQDGSGDTNGSAGFGKMLQGS
jgi:hypothetical protein